MQNKILSSVALAFVIMLAGCTKDNYKAPSSSLSGKVTYQGQPVGVRSNGVQLELWQRGYQLFSKIPVYLSQDGSFSTSLFDGDYKLVRLSGNGPWVNNTDTIDVKVQGATTVEVPVVPYYTITNATFQKAGTTVTASGMISKISTAGIERATLYIGTTTILDANNNSGTRQDKTGADLANLTQPIGFSIALPAALAGREYVFARIGVKTLGIGEMVYSDVQKIQLK